MFFVDGLPMAHDAEGRVVQGIKLPQIVEENTSALNGWYLVDPRSFDDSTRWTKNLFPSC